MRILIQKKILIAMGRKLSKVLFAIPFGFVPEFISFQWSVFLVAVGFIYLVIFDWETEKDVVCQSKIQIGYPM